MAARPEDDREFKRAARILPRTPAKPHVVGKALPRLGREAENKFTTDRTRPEDAQ